MQYVYESLRIIFYAVYIDGRDASRDVVVQDRELDVFYQEGFPDLCDTAQLKIGASNPFIDLHSRMDEVFFLGISANEYGRRQLLLMKYYDNILRITRDGIRGCFIRYVEELERVRGDGYFKMAIHGGNGPDLAFWHTDLHIFDGIAFFIDDSSTDSDTLLRKDAEGKKKKRQ